MQNEIKIAFGEDGKARVLNEEYTVYCANEEIFKKLKEAWEKQIPKKVVKKKPICYNKTKDGQEDYVYDCHCPLCDAKLKLQEHHCPCGQALDWSDTE